MMEFKWGSGLQGILQLIIYMNKQAPDYAHYRMPYFQNRVLLPPHLSGLRHSMRQVVSLI